MSDYKQMFRLDYVVFKAAPSFGAKAKDVASLAVLCEGNWAVHGETALLAVPPQHVEKCIMLLNQSVDCIDFEQL